MKFDLRTAGAIARKILEVAEVVASLTPVGASIVTAIKIASAVGTGLVQNIPEMENIWNELQAAKANSAPITPEKWAEYDAAADAAHADLQSELDKIIAGGNA